MVGPAECHIRLIVVLIGYGASCLGAAGNKSHDSSISTAAIGSFEY